MTGFSLAGSAAWTSVTSARDASSIARRRSLMRSLFSPNPWSEYYAAPKKSPAQSRGMQGETDPSAEGDHADPHQKGNSARDLRRQGGRVRRDSPTLDIAAGKQMKDRHVDARQDEKTELRLEIGVVRVVEGVGGEEQRTRDHGQGECRPG